MEQSRNLFFNDEFASQYDDLVKKQNWYGSEVLFGMVFEYIKKKDRILDIGIGAGSSATGFHALGLKVYGLDYSNEMLEVCKKNEIAVDLKQFDLSNTPLPYPTDFFDHMR
jgi:2-polyprenyl-3-methyl-5-hydroxy-6-metoxy-1,4-benzoquinol methylase